jgi:hypothetical protein
MQHDADPHTALDVVEAIYHGVLSAPRKRRVSVR